MVTTSGTSLQMGPAEWGSAARRHCPVARTRAAYGDTRRCRARVSAVVPHPERVCSISTGSFCSAAWSDRSSAVPARDSASGETSRPTFNTSGSVSVGCFETVKVSLAARTPGEAPRMRQAFLDQGPPLDERALDRGRHPSALNGSARLAASSHASSSDACDEATTGVPHAIASMIGMPNPSKSDG